jgi:inclusion membrane protein
MTALEQELQEENERLQEENERLYQQVGQLQAQLSTMTAKEQAVKPLIEEIKRQEQEIMSLNSSLIEERKQNEKLLALSKNERLLRDENEKLRSENSRKDAELKQERKNLEALADEYKNIIGMFPKKEDIKNLIATFKDMTSTFKGADKTISLLNVASSFNTAIVAIVAGFVLFAGYHMYFANQNAKEAATSASAASKALYNEQGYSVLNGSQASQKEETK